MIPVWIVSIIACLNPSVMSCKTTSLLSVSSPPIFPINRSTVRISLAIVDSLLMSSATQDNQLLHHLVSFRIILVFQSGAWSFSYTELYVLMNSPWDVEEWKESVSWFLDESQHLTKHLRNKVLWMDFRRFRSALAENWACWWFFQMAPLRYCTMDWKDAKFTVKESYPGFGTFNLVICMHLMMNIL